MFCALPSQIIARVSMDNRTRALVQGIQKATDMNVHTSRVEELSLHLLEYPETRGVAVKVWGCFSRQWKLQSL